MLWDFTSLSELPSPLHSGWNREMLLDFRGEPRSLTLSQHQVLTLIFRSHLESVRHSFSWAVSLWGWSLNLSFWSPSLSWAYLIVLNISTWMFFRDPKFLMFPPKRSLPDILYSVAGNTALWATRLLLQWPLWPVPVLPAFSHQLTSSPPSQCLFDMSFLVGSNCCHPGGSPHHLINLAAILCPTTMQITSEELIPSVVFLQYLLSASYVLFKHPQWPIGRDLRKKL